MAISSIISFGFGNGTFDPGVSKLPTLGYTIHLVPTTPGHESRVPSDRPHSVVPSNRSHSVVPRE